MKTSGNAILITGGASGIGLALAKSFTREGNRVMVCGRDAQQLEEAMSTLPDLLVRQCDLVDKHERLAFFDWALDELPELNVVINNAGIAGPVDLTIDELDVDTVERQLLVDLSVPIDLSLRFLPHLRKQPLAALVFVSSGLIYSFDASSPAYSAAKAGIHVWAQSMRYQLKGTSVAVFDVLPPTVDTNLTPDFDAAAMKALRAISPEDVADAVIEVCKTMRPRSGLAGSSFSRSHHASPRTRLTGWSMPRSTRSATQRTTNDSLDRAFVDGRGRCPHRHRARPVSGRRFRDSSRGYV